MIHAQHSHTRRSRPSGFTLLEVLLALVLILGMIGGLLGFYQYAVEVRRTVLEETRLASAHRIAMDQITSELRCATVSPNLGYTLSGTADRIQFLTTVLPKPGVWDAKESDKIQPKPTQDLRVVTYNIRVITDEENQPQIIGLECIWKTTLLPKYTEENQFDPSVLMTPEFKFIRFRYHDGSTWSDTWGGGPLPVAVEVTLGREPLPEGTEAADYPFPTHQRTIFIPGSGAGVPALRQARAANPAPDNASAAGEDSATQPADPNNPNAPTAPPTGDAS